MDWKLNIFNQLKYESCQSNVHDEIIKHYGRLLENNLFLQNQCVKFENDIHSLRLANSGLEKASAASRELTNINDKLSVANEELLMHLREKDELAREVLRLHHALKDVNEKLITEEIKVEKYKKENELLINKIDKTEVDLNDLHKVNEILREEFSAVKNNFDQLQIEYNRLRPLLIELEQQLEIEKRNNKQREDELIQCKKLQLEMLDAEVERYNKRTQQTKESEENDSTGTLSPKRLSESSRSSFSSLNQIETSENLSQRDKKPSTTNLFSNIIKIFNQNSTNITNDRLYRTSTVCFSATVPTHEIHNWDCTELEVYTLCFQPSGSILATGGSDKIINLWQISQTGRPNKFASLYGSHGAINSLDFDNEGTRLIAGCSGDKAYIWSYGDFKTLKDTFTGHNGLIHSCKFISGTKLTTGCADRLIKIWDFQSRQCIQTLFAGSKCHDLVIIDATGTIVSGHFDKKIRIWDTLDGKCRRELQYDASITSLSYNCEKQLLLACLRDDTLKLIDLRQNNVLYSLNHDYFQVSNDTNKCVLSPDGRYACSGSQDGSLFIWNTTNGTCEKFLNKKHSTMVTSVAWHPEGKYVASCEKHRRVILWSD